MSKTFDLIIYNIIKYVFTNFKKRVPAARNVRRLHDKRVGCLVIGSVIGLPLQTGVVRGREPRHVRIN